jgi:hypothetical protein
MSECLSCAAKSQLYLCNRCADYVLQILTDLPWWLDRLTETAVGQAALGDTAGRHTRRDADILHGDDSLASHIEAFPDDGEQDLDEARRQRYIAAQRHALAAGGVNAPASELLDTIANMLSTWIRDLCETRCIPTPAVVIPARAAKWLATNVNAIASHPAADEFADELEQRTREIQRIVNRPNPPRFIGPCPGSLDAGHDRDCHKPHPHTCGTALKAHRTAIDITCPACRTTHNVERVANHLGARADAMRLTSEEILAVMQTLGTPIPERTWLRWRREDRIKIRGYRRPNQSDGTRGAIGLTRKTTQDEPVYRVAEVRKVQAVSIQHADATCRKVDL